MSFFSDGERICATGHPSFVMSDSFSNQMLAQIELWKNSNPASREDWFESATVIAR